jgi:flavin reductase (DIM6/NTAB) family NADH-FMN oxidoreductase RutF
MAKVEVQTAGALFPTPVILATTVSKENKPNIITLAWVGVVCSQPFVVSLAIRPSRYSHQLLTATQEVVINVPTRKIVAQTDRCGTVSGRNTDKAALTGLTFLPAALVSPPLIAECPINLEGKVKEKLSLGTHDLFLTEIVKVHVDEGLLDEKRKIDFTKLDAFVYLGTEYFSLKEVIGHYGYTA